MITEKTIKAFWYSSNNFGDALNYFLLSKISGKHIIYSNKDSAHLIALGSILSEANQNTTVWGAGIANKDDYVSKDSKIITVRGKLSREACIKSGHHNEISLGDPALLLPGYYNKEIEHKYIGIIPHWKEIEKCIGYFGNSNEILIINPFEDIQSFIDKVLSCKEIFSSSLHGLILADAYKVPNKWITFGEDIGGDGTKFHDYYSSFDASMTPLLINNNILPSESTSVQDISQITKELKASNPFL